MFFCLGPGFKNLFYFFIIPLVLCKAYAQDLTHCQWTRNISKAYLAINHLDLEEAAIFLKDKSSEANAARILLEDYIDFYRIFIYENKSFYLSQKKNKTLRISMLKNSTLEKKWNQFLQAEIQLHWTLIFLKMNENLEAFNSCRAAVQLLEANQKEFPDFPYTYKSLGLMHALLGTIPDELKIPAKLFGLEGNLYQGKNELMVYLNYAEKNQDLFKEEAYAAYAFLQAYLENLPKQAFNYWSSKLASTDPTPLNTWVQARLALRAGYNDAAINIILAFPTADRKKLPFLSFLIGVARLNKLDTTATLDFLRFLNDFQGNSYVKETYQKMSWASLIKNDINSYHNYKKACAKKGLAQTDEDKLAHNEAISKKIPDQNLLKARLLFDGGYYRAAFELLEKKETDYLRNIDYQLEYAYRMGRISQSLNKYDEALIWFDKANKCDPAGQSYMSCNAHLQSGIIWEERKNTTQASLFYKKTLAAKPKEFSRSLHQKAKAGLLRIKH